MDLLQLLKLIWVPTLAIALVFLIKAMYLSDLLASKHGIVLRKNIIGLISISELKITLNSIEEPEIKSIITKLIDAKIWLYAFIITTALIYLLPYLFDLWISS